MASKEIDEWSVIIAAFSTGCSKLYAFRQRAFFY